MVYLREFASATGGRGYQGPAGTRLFSLMGRAWDQVVQGDLDEAALRALTDVAGAVLHLPTTQITRSARGAAALIEGQTANPAALLFGPPPKDAK